MNVRFHLPSSRLYEYRLFLPGCACSWLPFSLLARTFCATKYRAVPSRLIPNTAPLIFACSSGLADAVRSDSWQASFPACSTISHSYRSGCPPWPAGSAVELGVSLNLSVKNTRESSALAVWKRASGLPEGSATPWATSRRTVSPCTVSRM